MKKNNKTISSKVNVYTKLHKINGDKYITVKVVKYSEEGGKITKKTYSALIPTVCIRYLRVYSAVHPYKYIENAVKALQKTSTGVNYYTVSALLQHTQNISPTNTTWNNWLVGVEYKRVTPCMRFYTRYIKKDDNVGLHYTKQNSFVPCYEIEF